METLNESRNISNSEVTTWLSCRQQYDFAFFRNLAPRITPTPLARGTLGHEAFSVYIQVRLTGGTHEQAMRAAGDRIGAGLQEGISLEIVMEVKFLFERYMAYHNGWPQWELLGTEERVDLKITDTLTIPIRYDLMVSDRTSDRILVGDFKFTYDFWAPHEHDTNVQMPKYISVMQANGIPVHGGFLEEVRTRTLGKEKAADPKNLWRRTFYYPTPVRKRNTLKQHIAASLEIERYRNLPDAEREAETIPVFNKHGACKYCNFVALCNSKLDGKDIEYDISVDYVDNTYGYNKTTMEDLL